MQQPLQSCIVARDRILKFSNHVRLVVCGVAILLVEVLAGQGAASGGDGLGAEHGVVALNLGKRVGTDLVSGAEGVTNRVNVITPALQEGLLVTIRVEVVVVVPAMAPVHKRKADAVETDVSGNTPVEGTVPGTGPAVISNGTVAHDGAHEERLCDEPIALPGRKENHFVLSALLKKIIECEARNRKVDKGATDTSSMLSFNEHLSSHNTKNKL